MADATLDIQTGELYVPVADEQRRVELVKVDPSNGAVVALLRGTPQRYVVFCVRGRFRDLLKLERVTTISCWQQSTEAKQDRNACRVNLLRIGDIYPEDGKE